MEIIGHDWTHEIVKATYIAYGIGTIIPYLLAQEYPSAIGYGVQALPPSLLPLGNDEIAARRPCRTSCGPSASMSYKELPISPARAIDRA